MDNKGTPAPKRKEEYRPTIEDNVFWIQFGKYTLIVGSVIALVGYILF